MLYFLAGLMTATTALLILLLSRVSNLEDLIIELFNRSYDAERAAEIDAVRGLNKRLSDIQNERFSRLSGRSSTSDL